MWSFAGLIADLSLGQSVFAARLQSLRLWLFRWKACQTHDFFHQASNISVLSYIVELKHYRMSQREMETLLDVTKTLLDVTKNIIECHNSTVRDNAQFFFCSTRCSMKKLFMSEVSTQVLWKIFFAQVRKGLNQCCTVSYGFTTSLENFLAEIFVLSPSEVFGDSPLPNWPKSRSQK